MSATEDSLGTAGRALWDAIHERRSVGAEHKSLVLNACRVADNLERISDELAMSGLITTNQRGDDVANPLLVEHRMQLSTYRQILSALGVEKLEDEVEENAFEKAMAEAAAHRASLQVVK